MPHQLQAHLHIIITESAIVDLDWVLKIHKDLESSSADSYLYPQKSHAVKSGECTRLHYYNKVPNASLISLRAHKFAESNEVTLHRAQILTKGIVECS